LFIIYIDDIDEDLKSKIAKFADDTKIRKSVKVVKDGEELQKGLNTLYQWSQTWLMEFNMDKCVCIHVGKNNINYEYHLGTTKLNNSVKEKELGVIIDNSLNFSDQCAATVKKANRMLGVLRRKVKYKSKEVVVRLYKALVRPVLEYCVQLWNPIYKGDINALEGVQRRALKMVNGFYRLSYTDRLIKTGLPSLSKRRVRGDLIQMYKIATGQSKLNAGSMFTFSGNSVLRGHAKKLFKLRCNTKVRSHFFSNRLVDVWNGLPEAVVQASSVNGFKNNLDKCNFFVDVCE